MQPVTFYLPFLLISIIFINKCAKIPLCLFNALAIAFANFLSHKHPNEHPLGCLSYHSAWNMCPIICGIYIFLHGIFTRAVREPSPLGEHHPRCSMTPITKMTTEKRTYNPWSFITQLVVVFTMKDLLKIKTSWQHDNILHIGALYIAHYGIYNNHIFTYAHFLNQQIK